MNKKFGWSPNSRMAATYSHLIDEDVEEAIVKADADPQTALKVASKLEQSKPRRCLRCESVNEASSRYCSRCAFPLDTKAAAEAVEAEEQKNEAESILNLLIKDERVQEVVRTFMGKLSAKRVSAQIFSSSFFFVKAARVAEAIVLASASASSWRRSNSLAQVGSCSANFLVIEKLIWIFEFKTLCVSGDYALQGIKPVF